MWKLGTKLNYNSERRITMTLDKFIKENKEELDEYIKKVCPYLRINNHERRLWVYNDEGLYNWARRSGVRI